MIYFDNKLSMFKGDIRIAPHYSGDDMCLEHRGPRGWHCVSYKGHPGLHAAYTNPDRLYCIWETPSGPEMEHQGGQLDYWEDLYPGCFDPEPDLTPEELQIIQKSLISLATQLTTESSR